MRRGINKANVAIERLDVSAYTVPTDAPESDGTLEWDSTTIVVVEVTAGGVTGLGYTYGPKAVAALVDEKLTPLLREADPEGFAEDAGRELRTGGRRGEAQRGAGGDRRRGALRRRERGVPPEAGARLGGPADFVESELVRGAPLVR